MTFRVDRTRQLGIPENLRGAGPERDPLSTAVADRLSTKSGADLDATLFTRAERTYDTPLAVSNARRISDSVRRALGSIAEYRESQIDLAKESKELALSSRGNELDAQRATYETQITRIRDTTTFNGVNLLTSGDIDLGFSDVSQGLTGSFILGSPAAAAVARSARLNTPTRAANNIASYEKTLVSLKSFIAGTGALVNRIDAIGSAPNTPATSVNTSLTDDTPTNPKLFAAAAAQVLAEPYAPEKTTQLILAGTPVTAPALPKEDDELGNKKVG
jgi:hypothetical protein